MTDDAPHLPSPDIAEMIRASVGILTSKIANDGPAVDLQLQQIITDQQAAAHGDVGLFAALMAKQVEAATIVAWALLKSLAPRAGMSEQEINQVIGRIAAEWRSSPPTR